MNWILFAECVLIALEGVDLGNREVERVGETDHLRPALQDQLKLCVAESRRPDNEFRIKVAAGYQADAVISVCAANNRPIAAVIGGDPRTDDISKNELLLGLVLEPHGDINHVIVVQHASAKVSDGGGEIGRLVTERLVSAELRRSGWLRLSRGPRLGRWCLGCGRILYLREAGV